MLSSRPDWTSQTVFLGVGKTTLERLQLVQKVAARLLTRVHKQPHVTHRF